jgi:hypothetical protein
LRILAVVTFGCLGTVSCVGITLGETFGDPVEEAGKAIQMWLFVPTIVACSLLLAYCLRRGGWLALLGTLAACVLVIAVPTASDTLGRALAQ